MARERHKVMLLAAERNTCRALVACQAQEPLQLTYLRQRWDLEIFPLLLLSGCGVREVDEEVNPLLLDPVQWKEQDHYIMLGLGKQRYKASAQEVRKAYRQKVLVHHPDKQTEDMQDDGDDHFKCIKIAYDILFDHKKRRAYDSVDPTFDDFVPSICTTNKDNYYNMFGPVFRENSRWSTKQPVPQLGSEESAISEVDSFFSFWYNLESWREFSYLDEENPEKGECREERRWIEKQNKAARQKRKKEEMARLRTLVDNAYACDPRVKKFKETAKAEKEAEKRAKMEAAKKEAAQRRQEEKRKQEVVELRRKVEEDEVKAQAALVKKEKEAVKKVLKKERKVLRGACKEHNYFASTDSELVTRMQDLDKLCLSLPLDTLQQLNERLGKSQSVAKAQAIFEEQVSEVNRLERVKIREASCEAPASASGDASVSSSSSSSSSNWSMEEVQLLVKAVSTFPAGTVKRWEAIALFVNTHSPEVSKEKNARMVISKVKNLQKLEGEQKASLNKQAFAFFEQRHQPREKTTGKSVEQAQATPSERYDVPKPWTTEEQKLLEKALRSNPASLGAERWDNIAQDVGSRTKEECVARVKELVARVKAKKQSSTTTM